jgi:hypothetical protein
VLCAPAEGQAPRLRPDGELAPRGGVPKRCVAPGTDLAHKRSFWAIAEVFLAPHVGGRREPLTGELARRQRRP